MTPAQSIIETARADAGLVTTPQAEAEMQRGRDIADAQNERMQHAYQEWIKSDVGEAAAKNIRPIRLHIAFSAGWEAAQRAARLPFDELESEAEHAAMLDWLSVRGPIE